MNEWIQKARNVSDSNHQTSSTRCYDNNQSRLARQDLLRRRDINLYTGGLHPRLLHGQQPQISPRLSLFSNQNTPETQPSRTSISGPGPCRAFPASVANNTPQMPSPSSFLQSPCSPPPSYQVISKLWISIKSVNHILFIFPTGTVFCQSTTNIPASEFILCEKWKKGQYVSRL